MSKWLQFEAIALATIVESIAPDFGCHVALTGGCLYKTGLRKDCDLLFYRIRQVDEIDREGLVNALSMIPGFVLTTKHGWVQKATYYEKSVDLFFPSYDDEFEYPVGGDENDLVDALISSALEDPPNV